MGPCTYRVTGTDTAGLTSLATAAVTWSSVVAVAVAVAACSADHVHHRRYHLQRPRPELAEQCRKPAVLDANDTSSGFGGGKVLIATLIAPAGVSTKTNTMTVYEYGSASTSRKAWLSRSPCDASGLWPAYSTGTSVSFSYTIGGADSSAVNMKAGETWYVIVLNQKPFGGNSCSSGTCDVAIKWYPPN